MIIFYTAFIQYCVLKSNSEKLKEMKELLEKEKLLHKEIRSDYKKISKKIDDDFEMVKKSKSSQ